MPADKRPHKLELPYDLRQRLTFSGSAPAGHRQQLLLDLFPFQPALNTNDAHPSDRTPLPWVLYIPAPASYDPRRDGTGIFHGRRNSNDARRSLPQWLHDTCMARGMPLVSIDHDLISSADSSSQGSGVDAVPTSTLLSTLREVFTEDHLNWSLLSAGPGAEADTGRVPLDGSYELFRLQGGVDLAQMVVVAAGDAAEHTLQALQRIAEATRFEAAALVLVDPQPARAGAQPQLPTVASVPPTLILASADPLRAQFADNLLAAVQRANPEGAALDALLPSSSASASAAPSAPPPAADATRRYVLQRVGAASAEMQALRANTHGQGSSSAPACLSGSGSLQPPAQQQLSSPEARGALTVVDAFMTHWLGSAGEAIAQARAKLRSQQADHLGDGLAPLRVGQRIVSVSRSRL